MASTNGRAVMGDLSNDNGNAHMNTKQYKDTDQTPSHNNPSTRIPLYNTIPTTTRPTNPNPSPTPSHHQTDSEENHLKLDLPSWPTFATHTAPDLKPPGRRSQLDTAGIHRRLCFSLDEKALFDLHNRHQYSSTTTSQQRSWGPSDQEPQRTAPEPIAPPYAPPKRARTPDGVPSWPGPLLSLHQQQQQQQQRNASQQQEKRKGNFMRRSSRRLARFFAKIVDDRPGSRNGGVRRIFGLKRYREEPPRAVPRWRPPISGHSTFRFDSLEAHPFSGPSLSDEPYAGGPVTGFRRQRRKVFSSSLLESQRSGSEDLADLRSTHGIRVQLSQRREEAIPPLGSRLAATRPSRSSESDTSVIVSPSVRALAALRGLPLPVSPEQVEAETTRRSSSIPRSRVRSPVNGASGSQRRFLYPTSTLRTVDLLEAFPEPPSPRVPRSSRSAPARMSLFPAVAGLRERSGNVQSTPSPSKKRLEVLESVVESAKKRKRASASSGPLQAPVTRADNAGSPSASNVWVSGALPEPSERDGSADNVAACNSPPLRGEDVDRYRPSGTPVYDRNRTSLCSVDETEDVDVTILVNRTDTPVSGKTGMTRYFSAASQVVPNRIISATSGPSTCISEPQRQLRSDHQVQRERAVANGALRFSFQAPTEAMSSGVSLSRQVAVVPVRTTSLTKACSHKIGAIRTRKPVGWDSFDGTQELHDSPAQKSGWDIHCFRCGVKRVVRRMARFARGQEQTLM